MNIIREINLIKNILKNYPEEFILNDIYNFSNSAIKVRVNPDEFFKKFLIFAFYFIMNICKLFFQVFLNI